MKKKVLLLVCFLYVLTSFSFLSAGDITVYNYSKNTEKYSYGANVRGWINFSFSNLSYNSIISLKNQATILSNITLRDFLNKSLVDYTCNSYSCGEMYASNGEGYTNKTFNLNYGDTKVIGLRIPSGNFSYAENISLKISSNNPPSCSNPLVIDVFDDGVIDWVSSKSSIDVCSVENNGYGCYSSVLKQGNVDVFSSSSEDSNKYCGTFQLQQFSKVKLGAYVNLKSGSSGPASFVFTIFKTGETIEKTCEAIASTSGEVSCDIELTTEKDENFTVCINAKDSSSSGKFQIGWEQNLPCGSSSDGSKYDFAIFARPLKYSTINEFSLNTATINDIGKSINLESETNAFIKNNYNDGECMGECIIPIKFYSGAGQTINISDITFNYKLTGLLITDNHKIYDLEKTNSQISMFSRKINLENTGLKVPQTAGKYNLTLNLDSQELAKINVEVISLPTIIFVYPTDPPAGAEITFRAIVSGSNITSYVWNFGDNSSIVQTTNSQVTHKYPNLGHYNLVLSVRNDLGEINKTLTIIAGSPKDYLNKTLVDYSNRISSIKHNLIPFPALVKNFIENKLNFTGKESELVSLKIEYDSAAGDNDKYLSIINKLDSFNLPNAINVTEKSSGIFIMNKNLIDLSSASSASGDDYSENGNENKEAIFDWFLNSLQISGEASVYSFIYGDNSVPAGSYINMRLSPKKDLGTVYVVISGGNVLLGPGLSSTNNNGSSSFTLSSLLNNQQKQIEFMLPERVSLLETPIYFFPPKTDLSLVGVINECNYNKICEKSLGEDWKNCRNDCKPWGRTLLYLGLLLLVMFIIYIAIQEWYKRNYENYLFKDKNELFNLIHFMDNAEKQGLKKEEMFEKLRSKNWDEERLDYAYKKFKGMRTGMWEIPIFKAMENKKVSNEIQNRNAKGISNKLPPSPIVNRMQQKPVSKPFQGSNLNNKQNNSQNQNINKP